MELFKGRTFSSNEEILGSKTVGSPVLAGFFNNKENFPSQEEAIKESVKHQVFLSSFIKKRVNGEVNEFDIRFFFPNGTEIVDCKHGALFAAKVLKEHFQYREDEIIFYLNESLRDKFTPEKIRILINKDKDIIFIPLSKLKANRINIDIALKNDIFRELLRHICLHKRDIINLTFCNNTKEYIFEVAPKTLKELQFDFTNVKNYCFALRCNAIFLTAKSDVEGFDYESRTFVPRYNEFEDILCGAAQRILAPFWSDKLGKNKLKCLFPQKHGENGGVGGVMHIECSENSDTLFLGAENII